MSEEDKRMNECCSECGRPLTTPDHTHRQVPITVYGDHAHVDEGIADLITACWAMGIRTTGSCEGGHGAGKASIGFERGAAELFVGAATTDELDDPATFGSLGWRMREIRPYEDPEGWTWTPGGWPWAVGFAASFPPSDIPELAARIWRHEYAG